MKLASGRFRRSGPGLGRKLTLSYTLVTVGALLAVELMLFVGAFFVWTALPPQARVSADELSGAVAPRLQRPLAERPPDAATVREVLLESRRLPPGEDVPPVGFEKGELPDGEVVLVLDPDGRVVASVPEVRGFPGPGGRLDAGAVPGLSPILRAARSGEEAPRRLYERFPEGGYAAAAPVEDASGRVVGVVAETSPAFGASPFLLWLVPFVLIALGLTAAVGVLGAAFGFLTARGLTRRLKTLAWASESWSRGEFAVATRDQSGDEIGQLSRALDRMTARLDDLMRSRQDLAALEARNRFARDLHDSVKQQVFAASLQVDAARALGGATASNERLDRANGLLRQAQKELDVLIQGLRPVTLENRSLGGALREFAAGWSRGSGIPAEVLVRDGSAVPPEAPPEVEEALFRVAQEALANVARHSGARRAEVELAYGAGFGVVLRVSDDGRGFDTSHPRAGFGLGSMRERLERLGGDFRAESAPGRGARIVCSCPLAGAPGGLARGGAPGPGEDRR